MKTLIITNSYDATTDLLIKYLGSENIFRLNYDRYSETSIEITSTSITFTTPNFIISDSEIKKVLWRKPFNEPLIDTDQFIVSELKYIYREIANLFSLQNKLILVIPSIEHYIGKIVQLTIGQKYFFIPKWGFYLNKKIDFGEAIVKSLSSSLTSHGKIVYTTKVNKEKLDVNYPWFVQELIISESDITILFVSNKLFAYELPRSNDLIDWRKQINREKQNWVTHILPLSLELKILEYMNNLGLKFGRIDFLLKNNEYFFLEVNPNGQWAWLDTENTNGLMSEMLMQISPNTEIMTVVKFKAFPF